jgi:hypothetical protein
MLALLLNLLVGEGIEEDAPKKRKSLDVVHTGYSSHTLQRGLDLHIYLELPGIDQHDIGASLGTNPFEYLILRRDLPFLSKISSEGQLFPQTCVQARINRTAYSSIVRPSF